MPADRQTDRQTQTVKPADRQADCNRLLRTLLGTKYA